VRSVAENMVVYGADAEVSADFTPGEWWELGGHGIVREQQRVYLNFIRALDEFAK